MCYNIYIKFIPPPPPHSASCNIRISKCASALRKNTTGASCDDYTMTASGVFALVDEKKNTTSASCTSVKTILGTSL